MKYLPIVKVTVGNKNTGYGIRSFYWYDRSARNWFIKEQVKFCGKENVNIELVRS